MHGIFHKSDLSLDAVIKFFAAGFIVAAPTAYIFETIIMTCFAVIYYLVALITKVFTGGNGLDPDNMEGHVIMIFVDMLQAFLMAALVEEMCKYYSFRTVEHPDLIFLTGLNRITRDYDTTYGGNLYAYSSDNNAMVRTDSFETEFSNRTSGVERGYRGNAQAPPPDSNGINEESDRPDVRTIRQKAAAVTTAMISVAVGLACAENFIYVFFLSGSNTQDEMVMLLFRSIFPIHALCAAMQSIGVIEKFLVITDESATKIGVGKIILPAVILHGSFDSILMTMNTIIDFAVDGAQNQGGDLGYDFAMLNLLAACLVLGSMLSGLLWYYVKNRAQKTKLKLLEVPHEPNKDELHELT